jgi:hypothetical protein
MERQGIAEQPPAADCLQRPLRFRFRQRLRRRVICSSPMTFNERPGSWRTTFAQSALEIHLGGDASGLFPANTEMAGACEAQLASVLADALAYIAKHVAASAAVSGEAEIVAIEFGLSNYGEHREFEVFFSDDATYVLWAVRFQYGADPRPARPRLVPVGFSRRSW